MKILVSGFERFGEYPVNTSEIMLGLLNKDPNLHTVMLPVTFREAFLKLKSEIENFNPDVVVCLGLAAKRPRISLEKIAINLIDCDFPDNDGTVYKDVPIAKDAPAAYFTTLPLSQMLGAATSFPTEISYSAGAYVCNYLMYSVLHFLSGSEVRAGFIHLPELGNDQERILSNLESILKSLS